jgi:hypothetical protein
MSSLLSQDLKNEKQENDRLKAELLQMLENYSVISKKYDLLQKERDSLQKERDQLVKEKMTKYQYQCSPAMATCDGLYNMPQLLPHQPDSK